MTGLASLFDRQALWDYDKSGELRSPPEPSGDSEAAMGTEMPPDFAVVTETTPDPSLGLRARVAVALLAFDPNQKRGPDGRWIKMGGGLPSASPSPSHREWGRRTVDTVPRSDGGVDFTYRTTPAWGGGTGDTVALTRDEVAQIAQWAKGAEQQIVSRGWEEGFGVRGRVGPLPLFGERVGYILGSTEVGSGALLNLERAEMAELVEMLKAAAGLPDGGDPNVAVEINTSSGPVVPDGPRTGQLAFTSVRPLGDVAATYSGDGYRDINEYLRGESDRQYTGMADDIDRLTRAIAARPTRAPIEVWRGVGSGPRTFGAAYTADSMEGLEWEEDSFVSTTADEDVIRRGLFATPGGSVDSVKMRITVPEGSAAGRVGSWDYEAEVLLNRGSRYRITKDHGMVDGVRRLDVELISD